MDQRRPTAAARHFQLREQLLSIEGLALLRQMNDGDDEVVQARIEEIRRLADATDASLDDAVAMAEMDVVGLYRAWADTYDEASRPIRPIEEPVVWSLLEGIPPGLALDAACGTGRHARRLADLGHKVTGVDLSPEMLEKARERVPEGDFRVGDLYHLPVDSDSVDLVVCGLALDHCPTLTGAIAEMARVVRPGGRIIISDINPLMSQLGGAAHVKLPNGTRGFVRNHAHLHGDFITAIAAAGLRIEGCLEPRYGQADVALKRTAMSMIPDATAAAYVGLPAVVVWDLVRP